MHDLSYQYFGLALARLSAGGGTVVRLGGLYKALALIRRLRHPAHPFRARRSASFLECMLVFVQKRFEVLGLRFEDARDDEYLLQCL